MSEVSTPKKVWGYKPAVFSWILDTFIRTEEDTQKGIYKFGPKNDLPNRLMETVMASGTARRAVTKHAQYIEASGFIDNTAAKMMVNKKQTANQLLSETSKYLSYFNGFAWYIRRNGQNKIGEIRVIPFETVRKRLDGKFEVNPTYGQGKLDAKMSKVIPAFDPENTFTKVRQTGELLYVYLKTPDHPIYPIPEYFAQIEDIKTSTELSKLDLETVRNAFLPSAILTMIGEVDNETKDENGYTEQDYLDDALEKFTGNVTDKDGLSGRQRLLVLSAKTKDEVPNLQTFDSKAIIEASIAKRDDINRAVCRLWGVHPVLLGFSDAAVLGNQQAIANASAELMNAVIPYQNLITEAITTCFPDPGDGWKISQYNPVRYIPTELFKDLTQDERRHIIGMPPAEVEATAGMADTLKALNSLSPLVANKVLEALTESEIRSLVSLQPKQLDPNAPLPNPPAP